MHDSNILHSLPSFTNPERALNSTSIKGKSTSYIGIATLLLSALLLKPLDVAGKGGPRHSGPYDPQFSNPRKYQRTGYFTRNQVSLFRTNSLEPHLYLLKNVSKRGNVCFCQMNNFSRRSKWFNILSLRNHTNLSNLYNLG